MTDDNINDAFNASALKISETIFNNIKELLLEEGRSSLKDKQVCIQDLVNFNMFILSSICMNILNLTCNNYEYCTNEKMNINELISIFNTYLYEMIKDAFEIKERETIN